MSDELYFGFYGVALKVSCADAQTYENILRDFSFFSKDKFHDPDIAIDVHLNKPPYDKVPALKASLYNPDSIVYDKKFIRYVDHQSKALTIYDYSKEKGEIFSEDKDLLHELAYLLILSRIGELLDKKGIHRIHALGFSFEGKGVLCLLPQAAGKTTLALDLLKDDRIKLLSDDTVLIHNDARLLPFPTRIGISADKELDIPGEYLRNFTRRKYGSKVLIDIDYFKSRISAAVKPWVIFIGVRKFSSETKMLKVNKLTAVFPLIRDAVIGLGLAQMVEYFLRFNLRDIFSKIGIVFSRIVAVLKLLRSSRVYCFIVGRDTKENSQALLKFIGAKK